MPAAPPTPPPIWQLVCNDHCTIHKMSEHAITKKRVQAYRAFIDNAADFPPCSPHTMVQFFPRVTA